MTLNFKPLNNPILILTDGADHHTGLARMGRDLAALLCTMPQFRVGYLGLGAVGKRKFPWMQYSFPDHAGFGEHHIQEVWHDFAGGDYGVIMSLWDASRMLWFGQPQMNTIPGLAQFLGAGRTFQKWGYFPVDGVGPNGDTLGVGMHAAVQGYDRVLAASEWGMNILNLARADWIPHGIWTHTFKPVAEAKEQLGWDPEQIRIGCNMANQARKDWPVAFETIAVLRGEYGNRLRFWAHTDVMIRYWNIYALAKDFGVEDIIEVTTELSDEQLALRYSACDCTILPSGGEGFGYPIAEAQACGTACVVTDYAAGKEIVPDTCRVAPVAYRVDTTHNVQRAVLSGHGFAELAKVQVAAKREDWEDRSEEVRSWTEHLDWDRLKTMWMKWLLEGLR